MDRNTIAGIILIFAIFIGSSIYSNSRLNKSFESAVAAAENEIIEGNLERARTEYVNALRFKPNHPEVLEKLSDLNDKLGITNTPVSVDSSTAIATQPQPIQPVQTTISDSLAYGVFSSAATGENSFVILENDKIELKIARKGGRVYSVRLKEYSTHDSLPLILFDGDSTVFGFKFFTADNKGVETNNLYFDSPEQGGNYIADSSPATVAMRLNAGPDSYIEYKYTLEPGKYSVGFNVSFRNLNGILPANQNSVSLDWKMFIPQQEKGRTNEETYTTIKYKHHEDDVEGLKTRSKKDIDELEIPTKLSWVAFQDQFFSSVIIADEYFNSGAIQSERLPASIKYMKHFSTELSLPVKNFIDQSIGFKFYFGPNHISTLRKEGNDLEEIVFLGKSVIGWINRFIIIPVFNWLDNYIGSYGIIILILTIMLKIVLFPLTFKSFQSQAKMMVLKPQVEELGLKFPKKEDAMKKQQATMDLYKRAGVNPMGGCLPMLLQFPILFAMFRFFPVSIELRQEAFLWATDLSTFDSILTLPFTIPMYGNHVSLFTILMTASSLLSIKQTGSSPGSDQPGMKMMMYMMPVMFMLFLNNFSSGLTYYYFLANIISYFQNMITKKFIDHDKLLAKLEENKKKPVKKSKWQQRLEDAAKQRGINPPKR